MAVQHLAIIGQLGQHLARAKVAVVITEPLDRLAIDDDAPVGVALVGQRVDQPARGRVAKAAIALRQSRCRYRPSLIGRQRIALTHPGAKGVELRVGLDRLQLRDDLPLLIHRQMRPARAEAGLCAHDGRHFIALQLSPVLAFLVETGFRLQLEHLAQRQEGRLGAVLQPQQQQVALLGRQPLGDAPDAHDLERVDLLQQAAALEQRVRLGEPWFAVAERVGADLGLLERALVKDDLEQPVVDGGRQHVRVVRRLLGPDFVELFLEQVAAGVEIVPHALRVLGRLGTQSGADGQSVGMLLRLVLTADVQEFAEGARVDLGHLRAQAADADLDLAALVAGLVRLVGLAVRFESAPLVEVPDGATELGQGQRLVQRAGAELVRVEHLQFAALRQVGGEQPIGDEVGHQRALALLKPVAPPPRRARLRIAPVAENARASRQQAGRSPAVAVRHQVDRRPTE